MITDTHFGIHPMKQDKWLKMQTTWFNDFLVPFLRKHYREGDVLCMLGDVFDNRTSINIKVMNMVIEMFQTLGSIMPVHILVGNHDMWAMNNTDICSTASIRHIPNINLYTQPTQVMFGNSSVLMCPWITSKNTEHDILKSSKADYLFTHSDLKGVRTQLYPTRPHNRNILELKDFESFKRVFSGHIHINQTIGNFTFIGSPYHLDRNDIGNTKGIYVFDPDKNESMFVENTLSPQYQKITIKEESDLDRIDKQSCNFNYTDLYVYTNLVVDNKTFRKKLDLILNEVQFESISWIDNTINQVLIEEDVTVFDKDIADGTAYDPIDLNINLVQASKEYNHKRKYMDNEKKDSYIKEQLDLIITDAFKIYNDSIGVK